jgi:hypothetical protein
MQLAAAGHWHSDPAWSQGINATALLIGFDPIMEVAWLGD